MAENRKCKNFFSIIIPVYKVEKYLSKCVESVVSQNFEDWEAILVDDGSPDNCPALCDDYAKKDKRIKVIHKPNGGLSDARNAGIATANGKYILFLDSDDYLYSDTVLAEISNSFKNANFPEICYLPNEYWSSSPNSVSSKYKEETLPLEKFLKRVIKNYYLHTAGQQFVLRLDYLKENGLRFKKGILHEDELWFSQILMQVKKVHICPCVFYFYVDNRDGSIINSAKEKNVKDKLYIANKILFISKSLPRKLHRLFITRAAQIVSGLVQSKKALEITSNSKELKKELISSESLLLKSTKMKHKILYLYAKLKRI